MVVHLSSHYVLALPAVDLRDKTLERNFDRFVREVGLTGKTVTIRCDNEVSLPAAAERLTARSTVSRAVIDPVAGYTPQSKGGVERMVAVVKQSFWSVWLDLELEVTRSQSAEAEIRLSLEIPSSLSVFRNSLKKRLDQQRHIKTLFGHFSKCR